MAEAEYCGRISIMHAGKIIERGNPRELVAEYKVNNLEELFINLVRSREKTVA
jgi:ABC-2 type transport system ATP-binding protein